MTSPVGTIQMWATASIPTGWLACEGQTVDSVDYPALATALGASGSFQLPDFRDRLPCMTSGSDLGIVKSESLKYAKTVAISSDATTEIHSDSVSGSGSSTSSGSHTHGMSLTFYSVFLDSPTSLCGGWSHLGGSGLVHNANQPAPGCDVQSSTAYNHQHTINRSSQGSWTHDHTSVSMSGNQSHTHTVSVSNETVTKQITDGGRVMPERRMVSYIIRAL